MNNRESARLLDLLTRPALMRGGLVTARASLDALIRLHEIPAPLTDLISELLSVISVDADDLEFLGRLAVEEVRWPTGADTRHPGAR